jgi:hypothetical protein
VGIAFGAADRDDLVMKPLLVAVLWVLAGSYFGGLVERVTGLGMTLPVLAVWPPDPTPGWAAVQRASNDRFESP